MNQRTPRSSILTRIGTATSRLGEALFARSDARARSSGWEVTSSRRGLSRSYRDPRFDLIRSCPQCAGSGVTPRGRDCARCFGTGRVIHDPRRRAAG